MAETVYIAGKSRDIIEDEHHNKTIKIGRVVLTANDAIGLARQLATSDQLSELADSLKRAEYYSNVRDVAEDIKSRLDAGEIDDRDALIEDIDQTVDGSGTVIYTSQAMDCIRYSDNDGAYAEDVGSEGIVEDGSIQWSRLAYAAFHRDITEQLEALGVDVNSPFKCAECDETFDSFSDRKDHMADEHAEPESAE